MEREDRIADDRWATDRAGEPIAREVLIEELARMIAAYLTVQDVSAC